MKIVIDTSYSQNIRNKTALDSAKERDVSNAIAMHIVDILQTYTHVFAIFTYHDQQVSPSLDRSHHADCVISIDVTTADRNDNKIKVVIHPSSSSHSRDLAANIQKRFVAATGHTHHGIRHAKLSALQKSAVIPAALINISFDSRGISIHDIYYKACGEAIANGIIDTFHLSPQQTSSKGFYNVKVGPFLSKADAKSIAAQLSDKGYRPFIIFEKY